MENLISQEKSASSLFVIYEDLLENLAERIRHAGFRLNAFDPKRPSIFPTLDLAHQMSITASVREAVEFCESADRQAVNLQDSRQTAWFSIRRLGLRPLSDVFSQIEEQDVIEIYSRNHTQIFRSFNFYRCLSYSLDHVYTYQWWQLYKRDQHVTDLMINASMRVVSEQAPHTLHAPFPRHWVEEQFSQARIRAEIESRLASPLLESGRVNGYLNVFRIHAIENSRSFTPRADAFPEP